MEIKLGTILVAILIVGELNCQPINDNDDNLLINKNRDITLPNNNNNNTNSNNDSDNSSSNSSNSDSSDLINSNSNNNNKIDVPLIFPEDTKNYKILPSNVTIIKKLLHQNGESSEITDLSKPIPTETSVITKKPQNENIMETIKAFNNPLDASQLSGRNLKLKPLSTTTKSVTKEGDYYEDNYKSGEEVENYSDEVENVQEKNTKKPKIELEERFERKGDITAVGQMPIDIQDIDNPIPYKTETAPTSNPVLFIVIVVVVAFLCTTIYLSLFVWRRKLEGRYGMRERLVTNDDDVLQDDVHYRNEPHFGQSITVREIC